MESHGSRLSLFQFCLHPQLQTGSQLTCGGTEIHMGIGQLLTRSPVENSGKAST